MFPTAIRRFHGGPVAGHEYLLPFVDLSSQFGLPVVFYDLISFVSSTHLPQMASDENRWQEYLFIAELNKFLDCLDLRDEPGFHFLGQSTGGAAYISTMPSELSPNWIPFLLN